MSVDIKRIEEDLTRSFNVNEMFDSSNIGKDNTVEDKIVSFSMKLSELIKGVDLSNFYKKLETLRLEPLSRYSDKGFVDYDAINNIGYISTMPLEHDDENNFNVDNLFSQVMLMTATSNGKDYGFGNDNRLSALNRACTYMIASNISGCARSNYNEEELTCLNKITIMLKHKNENNIDFVDAYFSKNGSRLKEELLLIGIDDALLDQINHLSELKMSHVESPERFGEIDNQVNKSYAKLLSTLDRIDEELLSKYMSNAFNDEVLDYSDFGIAHGTEKMYTAINYLKSKMNKVPDAQKVAQKVV